MKKLLLSLVLSLFFAAQAQAESLVASVNRTTLPAGETLVLNVDYDGSDTNTTPDFSALNQDFKIYSQGQSFLTNIINGQMTQTRQWNLVLMPKNKGQITIPSFTLGQLSSDPITINVVNAAAAGSAQQTTAADSRPKFAFKAAADNLTPYVQQQVNLVLTLYDTGGFQGEMPVFEGAEAKDWIIKLLKEPTVSSKVVEGKSLREIKFYYALFPQKSGELMIPQAAINGYYLSKPNRRSYDPFADLFGDDFAGIGFGLSDMFANRNPVYLTTDPIPVSVKPAATANGQWWIPAEDVKLFAEWNPAGPVFRVGDAVSRTVYLRAAGVIDSQLPEIKFTPVSGMKQYPEKPLTEAKVENGEIIAVKKITNVYIPSEAGSVTLPEVAVEWFNVKTGRYEKAVLPALNLKILPAVSSTGNAPAAQQTEAASAQDIPQRGADIANAAEETQTIIVNEIPGVKLYGGLTIAFLLGILLSYLVLKPRHGGRDEEKPHGDILKYISRSSREKDFRALRDGIIEWARERYGDDKISNLKQVARQTKSREFETEINKLMEELYSNNGHDWNSEAFIKTFEKVYKRKPRGKSDEQPLPKLYK